MMRACEALLDRHPFLPAAQLHVFACVFYGAAQLEALACGLDGTETPERDFDSRRLPHFLLRCMHA